MRETMNVKDAQLRLEQLMEGHLPPRETPVLANPMYARAYEGFLKYGSACDTLREGSDGAGGFLVPDEFEERIHHWAKGKERPSAAGDGQNHEASAEAHPGNRGGTRGMGAGRGRNPGAEQLLCSVAAGGV